MGDIANRHALDVDVGGMPDPTIREEITSIAEKLCETNDAGITAEVDPPVVHHFSKGIYAREIHIPAGVLVVGKIHKTSHLNIISKGKVAVKTQFGTREFSAPHTFLSPIGVQRVVFAYTDTVWTTIHPTELTDVDEIEAEIIAKSYDEIPGLYGPEPQKLKEDIL